MQANPALEVSLQQLLLSAQALRAAGGEDADLVKAAVCRPLETSVTPAASPQDPALPAADLWALTLRATVLLAATDSPPAGLLEATAALQWLSLRDPETAPVRLVELAGLLGDRAPTVCVVTDGPLVLCGSPSVSDYLGRAVPVPPVTALCRCGRSTAKPFCDGSHAVAGFSGAKADDRVADRRDDYRGVAVTVLDNRGLCAHSGFCTDRIATVFHQGGEPFVTASGGRLDDVLLAIRDCPSGALAAAFADTEVRDVVDQARPPAVSISKDGPYRLSGSIPLVDDLGAPVPRNAGASLEHYSLCRCGQSLNKPFCSGMHWYADFHDPDPPDGPTLFEWAGGFPGLLRVTRLFYEKFIPADPLLASLFATMAPDHPQRVALWLGEVFGGPSGYTDTAETPGGPYTRMLGHHLGKMLTEQQRARWLSLLATAADEALLPADPEFRSAFVSYLEWGSRLAVENSQGNSHPPLHMPMPKWDWGTAGPPGARISALAPTAAETVPVALPGPQETPRFEAHIKGLFRASDRASMQWAFDLWDQADVSTHGPAILAQLQAGSMPCDGAWPAERVAVFERWLTTGCSP